MKSFFNLLFINLIIFSISNASESELSMTGSTYKILSDGTAKLLKSEKLTLNGQHVELLKMKNYSVWCSISTRQPSSTYKTWEGVLCRKLNSDGQAISYPVVGYFPMAYEKGTDGTLTDEKENKFLIRFER